MIACLYEIFGEVLPTDLEEAEKIFSIPFEATKHFSTFTKAVEETVDVAEVEKFPCTPAQVAAKSFNCVLRAQSFPDAATREQKRKVATYKMWSNFKTHFSKEIRDYQKDQWLIAKSKCDSAHAANKALLQAQCDLREITEPLAERMKYNFEEALNATKISATQQQAHATVSSTNSSSQNNLCQLIAELRQEIKEINADK